MASADRILQLKLIGDVSSINKSLKGTQGRLRATAGAAGSWIKAAGIGLAIEGVEALGDALGDAWTGFREGEKAGAQLGVTWKNLGLDAGDLQGTIDKISEGAKKLGTDDTEAVNAFNAALKSTGGDSSKAMERLRIAQDLVANGSAPNLAAAMRIIRGAANGSKRVVDEFGLSGKTAGDRVHELGRKVKGAAKAAAESDPIRVLMVGIGEGLEGIVGAASKGDLDGIAAGVQGIVDAIAGFGADIAPGIDGIFDKLLGGQRLNQLGQPGGSTWDDIKQSVGGLVERFQDFGEAIGPKFSGAIDATASAWAALEPHLQNALTLIQPVIDVLSFALATGLGFALDAISGALNGVATLLNTDWTSAWNDALATVQGLVSGFGDEATKIKDAIVTPIQEGIGVIRDAWNSLDFSIPAFDLSWAGVSVPNPAHGTVFDAFGTPNITVLPSGNFHVWDGTGDLIPDFAKGGIVMPRPGGLVGRLAEAGRPEAVIPLDRMGDLGGGNHYTVNVYVAPGGDLVEAGRQIDRALSAWEQRMGRRRLTA